MKSVVKRCANRRKIYCINNAKQYNLKLAEVRQSYNYGIKSENDLRQERKTQLVAWYK